MHIIRPGVLNINENTNMLYLDNINITDTYSEASIVNIANSNNITDIIIKNVYATNCTSRDGILHMNKLVDI